MPAHAERLVALDGPDDEGALVEGASLAVEERLCLVIFGFSSIAECWGTSSARSSAAAEPSVTR
ncbi:hypothetical protein AB0I54_46655 [Streptomyces sp. NPDC050625]|uniref:hypothetical protein n=1 Tax=Streptomyces sp. NPDC050625 TaxID=3154629 RepID=UPI003443F975